MPNALLTDISLTLKPSYNILHSNLFLFIIYTYSFLYVNWIIFTVIKTHCFLYYRKQMISSFQWPFVSIISLLRSLLLRTRSSSLFHFSVAGQGFNPLTILCTFSSWVILFLKCLELDNQALDVVADISQLFICYNPLKLLSETRSLLVFSLSHACAVEHFCLSVMPLIYPH